MNRLWLCFCADWYAGEEVIDVHEDEPDRLACHRTNGCGWYREEAQ